MFKDIAVHLTGSEEDEIRLAHAEQIAGMFDAHITGMQVHVMPEMVAVSEPAAAAFIQEAIEESQRNAEELGKRLSQRLDLLAGPHELRRVDTYPGAVGNDLASVVRTSDLFIGTRPYGAPTGGQYVEEGVLFGSGRPCIFVPPRARPPRDYGTVLVAWKDVREAARAVAEALPFLKQAQQVVVALVEEQGASEQYRLEDGADIGRYLSRHGVSAEIRNVGGWSSAGDALVNEATQSAASLIVMGGYGHSRFRELVLGGATRLVLENATVPVLMAH